MGAQPAWPPRSTPRLFVETALAAGPLRLDGAAAHYLVAVMRIRPGDPVKLFDDAPVSAIPSTAAAATPATFRIA